MVNAVDTTISLHSFNFADLNISLRSRIAFVVDLAWCQTLQGLYLSGITPCKTPHLNWKKLEQVGRQVGGTGLMVRLYKPTIRYELIY